MKWTTEQAYLSLLSKRLKKLLDLVQMKKPGSGYSNAEIQAFSSFPINEDVSGLLDCVQTQQSDNWLIRFVPKASRKAAVYYLQLKSSIISRLTDILSQVKPEEFTGVQRELKRIDLEAIKRSSFPSCTDKKFHSLVILLRSKIDERNDHRRSDKMDRAIKQYISILKYYAAHQKQLQNTKEWYDFLCISRYMLYGEKLYLLMLPRSVKK